MIIESVLTKEQCQQVSVALLEVRWVDGKTTAGAIAGRVKHNTQVDLTDRRGAQLALQLTTAISANQPLRSIALPRHISKLRVSRTPVGGSYGLHFDNAIMTGREGVMRTDLSFTLFLSEPDSYDGGELVIHGADDEISHKLPAGDMVVYPSGALHEVKPVTRGARTVCVGWIQSCVAQADKRTILFELGGLGAQLKESLGTQADETRLAQKLYADLMRQWCDI